MTNNETSKDAVPTSPSFSVEETRLPTKLKEQILAELPPVEERERLFRELQEQGGLSWEQFQASLGLAESKP
jgi:hypothetical protein